MSEGGKFVDQIVIDHAQSQPRAVAIVDGEDSVTYASLARVVDDLAAELRD